jgi:hypothetical protein
MRFQQRRLPVNYAHPASRISLNRVCLSIGLFALLSACSAGDIVTSATPTRTSDSIRTPTPASTSALIPTPTPTITERTHGGQLISQTIDPCSVITLDEADRVFNGPMKAIELNQPSSPTPIFDSPGATEVTSICLYGATQLPVRGFTLNLAVLC